MSNRKQELVKLLESYNEGYWERSENMVSDVEYDKLVEELRSIDPNHPLVNHLGDDKIAGTKVKHVKHMYSLDKVYEWSDLISWAEKVARSENELFCFSTKMDGISVEVVNHRLITRGDGEIGTDITHLAPWITARLSYDGGVVEGSMHALIEHKGPGKFGRMVGELLVPCDRFERLKKSYPLFEEFKTPRNMASGFANLKPNSESLHKLIHGGLPVIVCTWVNHRAHELTYSLKDLRTKSKEIVKKLRGYKKLPCDGIVCRLEDDAYANSLGFTQHHPLGSCAYKFVDNVYKTKIKDIIWQVGNDCVTPVALFDTVEIDGVEVERATCHNAKFVEDNNLIPGTVISIVRRGGVIPKIVDVEKLPIAYKADIPTKCPSCGQDLVRQGPDLVCVNVTCPGRCTSKIVKGLNELGMNGIGPALVERIVRDFYIPDIMEYCCDNWDRDLLLKKGYTAHEVSMICSELDRVMNSGVTDEQIFNSLCIPGASSSFYNKVIKYIGDAMFLVDDPIEFKQKCQGIPGLNSTALSHVVDFMIEHNGEFEIFYNLFTHKRPIDRDKRPKFCFTGALPIPRKELEQWVLDHGGYPVSQIAQANFLVSASPTSTSDKMMYARKHNIPVLTFEELKAQLSK